MAKERLFFTAALLFLGAALFLNTGCGTGERELGNNQMVHFRFQCSDALPENDAKTMIKREKFFDSRWNRTGGFPNRYEEKKAEIIKLVDKKEVKVEIKIIKDNATGLTWHGGGSETPLTYRDAMVWVSDLNRDGFFGYNDWRFPTLEEALSLLEKKKVENYHINPVFSRDQHSTWTCDVYSEIRMWAVSFNLGRVFKNRPSEGDFIRPVRTEHDDF